MQHNENTENLALLYAYGELDDNLQQEFAQHLKTCAKCQAIVRACAVTTAALPDIAAPAFNPAPVIQAQPESHGIWDYIAPVFSFKRLVPVGAMVLLACFLAVAAYQYGTHNAAADGFTDNMYAELTNIEHDIDNIFAEFELL